MGWKCECSPGSGNNRKEHLVATKNKVLVVGGDIESFPALFFPAPYRGYSGCLQGDSRMALQSLESAHLRRGKVESEVVPIKYALPQQARFIFV